MTKSKDFELKSKDKGQKGKDFRLISKNIMLTSKGASSTSKAQVKHILCIYIVTQATYKVLFSWYNTM